MMTCFCCCSTNPAFLSESSKRMQVTQASCENCVDRPSVNGIEPVKDGMLTIVVKDHASVVDAKFTWNNVRKGRRSSARRSKIPTATSLKVGVQSENRTAETVQYLSVFESERLGVAVLGQHFSENVVGVPPKKRRFLRQSTSPPPRTPSVNHEGSLSHHPQTPSPHTEESELRVNGRCGSGQWDSSESLTKKCAFGIGVENSKIYYLDDFSGIELLAAAACSGCIDNDSYRVVDSSKVKLEVPEDVGSSADILKEALTLSESGGSSVPDIKVPVLHNTDISENCEEVKRPIPSKDARLHWDLNTVMEEWEAPAHDPVVDSHNSDGVTTDASRNQNLNLEKCKDGDLGKSVDGIGSTVNSTVGETVLEAAPKKFGKSLSETPQANNYGVGNSDILNNKTPREITGSVSCKSLDSENSNAQLNEIDTFLPKLTDLSTITTAISKGLVDNASSADTVVQDLSVDAQPNNLVPEFNGKFVSNETAQDVFHPHKLHTCTSNNQLALEDPQSDCCGSEVSQDVLGHMKGNDYDSPFEDGEVRERIAFWEENEYVDYEFDYRYQDELDNAEYSASDKFEAVREVRQAEEKRNSYVEKDVNETFGIVRKRQPNFLPGNSSKDLDDVNLQESTGLSKQIYENKKGTEELRASSSGANLPHSGEPLTFDSLHRNGAVHMARRRSDNFGDSSSRSERELPSEKFARRERISCQGPGLNDDDRLVNSWESRNRYGYRRPRNFIDNPDNKSNTFNSYHNHSESRDYVPKRRIQRPFHQKGSPADNDDYYSHRIRKGNIPMRGCSRDRSRDRAVFFSRGVNRGGVHEDYDEPDGPYYLERNERGFSSDFTRPRKRSRSRSRTRSPTRLHFPRERYHLRKPRFSDTDFEENYLPPSVRSHVPPPTRKHRCFGDRKFTEDSFRNSKSSPVRVYKNSHRLDVNEFSERRFKSDDYFKHGPRHERYVPVGGTDRMMHKFQERHDDRRKDGENYERPNRLDGRDSGNEGACFRVGGTNRRGGAPRSKGRGERPFWVQQ